MLHDCTISNILMSAVHHYNTQIEHCKLKQIYGVWPRWDLCGDIRELCKIILECARGAGPAEGVLACRSDLDPRGILHRNWKKRPEIWELQRTPKMMWSQKKGAVLVSRGRWLLGFSVRMVNLLLFASEWLLFHDYLVKYDREYPKICLTGKNRPSAGNMERW